MSLLNRIKKDGGIADFGMVVSTPWAILNTDELITSNEYAEFKKLVADGKLKSEGKADPKKWSLSQWLHHEGEFYNV